MQSYGYWFPSSRSFRTRSEWSWMPRPRGDVGKQHAVFKDVGCRYDELHKYSQLTDTYTTHTSRNGLNYWPYFSSWISVCTSIAGTTLGPEAFQNIQALIISYNAVKKWHWPDLVLTLTVCVPNRRRETNGTIMKDMSNADNDRNAFTHSVKWRYPVQFGRGSALAV